MEINPNHHSTQWLQWWDKEEERGNKHTGDSMLGSEQHYKDMLKFYQSFYSKINDENSKYEKKIYIYNRFFRENARRKNH